MSKGLYDLLHSERGTWCLIVLTVVSVAVVTGRMDAATWVDMVKFLTMVLVASKTVTTAVETRTLKEPQIPAVPAAKVVSDPSTLP